MSTEQRRSTQSQGRGRPPAPRFSAPADNADRRPILILAIDDDGNMVEVLRVWMTIGELYCWLESGADSATPTPSDDPQR
jgi:hypothetical protein